MADFGSLQSCQALSRKTEKSVLTVYNSLFLPNVVKQTNAVLRIFDLQGSEINSLGVVKTLEDRTC